MKDKMKNLTKNDITKMDRFDRVNLITSVSGIKAAMLIGTISKLSISNVAIFSSIIHLGSNPPLIGLLIRPQTKRVSDTYQNIKFNNTFTINHVNKDIIKKAHYTSAKTHSNTSEFDDVELNEEYIDGFKSPFVKESDIGLGIIYRDEILLTNDCTLIIGEIDNIKLNSDSSIENGLINYSESCSVAVDGISNYYELNLIEKHNYIGRGKLPKKI
tara:strand:+ start:114 stop:758 length:645 start_codon:yes stop_codon:yes gene_type:complete